MSKQHSKVSDFSHSYRISNFISVGDNKLELNGLGMDKVLKDSEKPFLGKTIDLGFILIKYSNFGDLWFKILDQGTDEIEDLPFKHCVVLSYKGGIVALVYSPIKNTHKVVTLGMEEGEYRISYYPNNIFYPLHNEAIGLFDIKTKVDGYRAIVETTLEPEVYGFYYSMLDSGVILRNEGKEIYLSDNCIMLPFVVKNGVELKGEASYFYKEATILSEDLENDATHIVHKNTNKFHFPYPASLLSFSRDEVLSPISSSLKRWAMDNPFGDGEPTIVTDKYKYRTVSKEGEYRSWFGYAPPYPLPEFDKSFEIGDIVHGETLIRLNSEGIEFVSLLEIPFVLYDL